MHQSADQILVVIVLMFVTCVLIIQHNVIYSNYMYTKTISTHIHAESFHL